MTQDTKRLARANLMLDNACKAGRLDPVLTRLTMASTIMEKLNEGSGYARNGADKPLEGDTA